MRTIDTLLKYHFTSEETETFLEAGIINWCWGDGWISFDEIIENNIKFLSYFNPDKLTELRWDLRRICYEHDLDFWLQIWFFKANFRMARKVYWLLYWVTPFKRLSIALILFILLQKKGKVYYDKCERWNTQ